MMNAVKQNQLKKLLGGRCFSGLMEIYELNYRLLKKLLPDLDAVPDQLVSHVKDSLDLHLTIVERCKYTTTIQLTYYFTLAHGGKVADPELTIKLYHDARQAEAVACMKRGFMPVEHSHRNKRPYVDCRWESNIFVEKWLRYSLQQGHTFIPESSDESRNQDTAPGNECLQS